MKKHLLILSTLLVFLFQNCSKAVLLPPEALPLILNVAGKTEWCLSGALQGYTLDTFYVRNVSIMPWLGQFLPDSDSDGLPDSVEREVGFDPTNPRSRSGALDSLCFNLSGTNSCPAVPSTCNPTSGPLGMSECDIIALRLDQIQGHPNQGLDSDRDGIIDYFELISGTNAKVSDNTADPDHDKILNQSEFNRQSNPLFADVSASAEILMDTRAEQLTGQQATSCTGEVWHLAINHVPFLLHTEANSSNINEGVFRSHGTAQNTLVAVVKLKPKTGNTGNAFIYYQSFLVDVNVRNINLNGEAMLKAGEVLP